MKFKDIQINNRKYYTADFKLASYSLIKNHTHDFYEVITITSGEFIEYNNGEVKICFGKRLVSFY